MSSNRTIWLMAWAGGLGILGVASGAAGLQATVPPTAVPPGAPVVPTPAVPATPPSPAAPIPTAPAPAAPAPAAPAAPAPSTPATGPAATGSTSATAKRGIPETTSRFKLDEQGRWVETSRPPEGSDAAVIADARKAIAEDRPDAAETMLDKFLDRASRPDPGLLSQAYLLRGDAITAGGNEYAALYDYETVIRSYSATPEYVTAVERELDIAVRYVSGLKRKFLGMRFVTAYDEGEELLIRVQERLPGSRLAERAGIELADHYYRQRDLILAADAYELFLQNYPNSAYRNKAMQRRIFANIGRFKGPRYDGSALIDAAVLIRRYMSLYPAQANSAGLDQSLLNRIDESAALQLLEIANWYMAREDMVSTRATLQRLIRLHPQSAAAGQAIEILKSKGWSLIHERVLQVPEPSPLANDPIRPTAPAKAKEGGQ